MGQYYKPIILANDKKTILSFMYSHDYENGLKLMEHSYLSNKFVGAFESQLIGNPQRVVWAGDYADEEYTETVKRLENEHEFEKRQSLEKNAGKLLKPKMITEKNEINLYSLCEQSLRVKPKATVVKERYIVNHDKKQFIDKKKVLVTDVYHDKKTGKDWTFKIHPLPLMTCEGNNRGGGDFYPDETRNQGNTALIGTWARDLISIESKVPEGFTEVIFDLTENGPVTPPEKVKKPVEKEFTVEVTRYYVVTDQITVTAVDEEEAKEKAETESDNKDYTGQLGLDHVTSEIV